MSKKRLRDWMQNLIILLLAFSALFLLTRLFLFQGDLSARLQIALTAPPAASARPDGGGSSPRVRSMFSSVHIMVTGDSQYGRYGQLCASSGDPLLQQLLPLFQEALGSAGQVGPASEESLREALGSPGLFLDLTSRLPLAAVAAWLGEDTYFDRTLQAMALTTGGGDSAALFLLDGEDGVFRCSTALPASAVQALCESVNANGSYFAFESPYDALSPYSILVAQAPVPPGVEAALPAGYSAYNLLTALDFNAHTNYRYVESSGVEVVEESPRTLRIGPDGAVGYSGGDGVPPALYRTSGPGLTGALEAACRLAEALTEGTGASPLYLCGAEEREGGFLIRFRYQVDGFPVRLANGDDALEVHTNASAVSAFTYRCRAYTPQEGTSALLPPAIAAAIAASRPASRISIGYMDGGAGPLSAQWLAD